MPSLLGEWGPFLTTAVSKMINGFLKRTYWFGFTNKIFEVQHLLDSAIIAYIDCCLHAKITVLQLGLEIMIISYQTVLITCIINHIL